MSSHLHLRRYQPGDFAQVWRLHVALLQSVGAYLGDGPWNDDMLQIEAVYLYDHGEFLVGVEPAGASRIVGMGALRRTSETRAEIKRMRVAPDAQGRGYGRQILEALEARAVELGYTTLHLDTSTLQLPARRLYESAGYWEVRRGFIGDLEVIFYEKAIG